MRERERAVEAGAEAQTETAVRAVDAERAEGEVNGEDERDVFADAVEDVREGAERERESAGVWGGV